jgi:PAS domain S-box-containing protein
MAGVESRSEAQWSRDYEALAAQLREQSLELVRLREEQDAAAMARSLLDAAPDALVVVSQDERIRFVNLRAESLFCYERAELVGRELDRLIPQRFRAGHAGHVSSFFSKPGVRPMGSGLELVALRKDGTEIPIEVSLSPLFTKSGTLVSAAIRDVSERKSMEASAKLASERLASAVDSMQDAFALFDGDGRLVLCNSVYRRLVTRARPGPLVGAGYEDLLGTWTDGVAVTSAVDLERFREDRVARWQHDRAATFDLLLRDGRSLRVSDRRTPEGGIVETIADVTEDVRLAAELRGARVAADAANAAKSEFLSSMSHELRTPLNAILGFAQLLQRSRKEPISERHRGQVGQILKSGEHLLRLIDDILDLSRIEAGRVSIAVEPIDVLDVLREVNVTLTPMAALKDVNIEVDILGDGLPTVRVDRTRYAQILMNLGSNAIKYNRDGGKVIFGVFDAGNGRLRVSVRDNGIGIPFDKQEKLFQPFQRAGQEAGPIEGTGIGLVITKRLAELMGGAVGFASAPGEGSEFWVEVPIHTTKTASSRPPDGFGAGFAPLSSEVEGLVLYVEDNPANVMLMHELVSGLVNVDLLTAPTAESGVELARDRKPSVVVMDVNLPGMSGFDALRALQAIPETANIPVIALTAAASDLDVRAGLEAGFARYLTKPIKLDEFVSTINTLLPRHRPFR